MFDRSICGKNHSQTLTFGQLPENVQQLQTMGNLTSPFTTAALAVAVLCHMEADPEETFRMLDYLKGPAPTSPFEKQFIKERLQGKFYKSFSFFRGATPENGYTPQKPYTIDVSVNPYSFPAANWATVYVKSGGADSPRGIKLRCKPSTGQWFLNELQCLSDIRLPVEEDPWA